MRQLNFDLKTLQARQRGGAFATRRDRAYALDQAANLLHALGLARTIRTGGDTSIPASFMPRIRTPFPA